jgi:hypothetical protein
MNSGAPPVGETPSYFLSSRPTTYSDVARIYLGRKPVVSTALKSDKTKGDRGWDAFVNEAVCEHYGLDMAVVELPKKEKPAKKAEGDQQSADEKTETGVAKEKPTEDRPAKKHAKGKGKK